MFLPETGILFSYTSSLLFVKWHLSAIISLNSSSSKWWFPYTFKSLMKSNESDSHWNVHVNIHTDYLKFIYEFSNPEPRAAKSLQLEAFQRFFFCHKSRGIHKLKLQRSKKVASHCNSELGFPSNHLKQLLHSSFK